MYIYTRLIRVFRVIRKICCHCYRRRFQRGAFMLEKNIEKIFKNEVEKIGGKAFKFSSPGNNGVPDRIVLYGGKCYFVELKKPGAKPRKLQKAVMKTFNKLGFKVMS